MKTLSKMAMACLFVLATIATHAQVTCPSGFASASIVQTQTLTNVTTQNTTVTFAKTLPGTSTFTGVTLRAWVNTSQSFQLVNRELVDVPDYEVDVDRQTKFLGNGLNSGVVDSLRSYGPYSLTPIGNIGSSINVGPDSLFRQTLLTAYTANVVPFTGVGNVSVVYTNKGLIGVNGSTNYSVLVTSNTSVTFTMTYYFCGASALPAFFCDLTAEKVGDNGVLNWNTREESAGLVYRVEGSLDGNSFEPLGTLYGQGLTKSSYVFTDPLHDDHGKKYYRIAILYPDGTVKYSVVRMINWGATRSGMGIYPNPAGRQFTVKFGTKQKGPIDIQLFSVTGQLLERHSVNAVDQSEVPVTLTRNYPRGTYVLEAISNTGEVTNPCRIMLGF